MPNFISVATSIAELARGKKSHTQSITVTHPAYVMPQAPTDAPRTRAFALEQLHIISSRKQQL